QTGPMWYPREEYLYLLQLLAWGLMEGKVSLHHPFDRFPEQHLLDYILADLFHAHPDQVMKALLERGISPEEPWVDLEILKSKEDAEDAAQYLAEAVQNAIEEVTPPRRLDGD